MALASGLSDPTVGAKKKPFDPLMPQGFGEAPTAPAYQFRDTQTAQAKADAKSPFGAVRQPFAPPAESGFGAFSQDVARNPFAARTPAPSPAAPVTPPANANTFATDVTTPPAGTGAGGQPPGQNGEPSPFTQPDLSGQVSAAVSRLLQNPLGGFDETAALARENAIKSQQQQDEDVRNQAALSFLPGTGQANTPVAKNEAEQALAMRGFDADIAAKRADAERKGLSEAIQLAQPEIERKFQDAQRIASQAFQEAMQKSGFSHEDATNEANRAFEKAMQAAGFSHEDIQQLRQIQSNETMHMAELAQSDRQFGKRLGLDYAQLEQQRSQFLAELTNKQSEFAKEFELSMKEFGLNEKQVESALQSADFQQEIERMQIAMELNANNPAAMAPFADHLAETLARSIGMTEEQIMAGRANNIASLFTGKENGKVNFAKSALAQGIPQAEIDRVLGDWENITKPGYSIEGSTNRGEAISKEQFDQGLTTGEIKNYEVTRIPLRGDEVKAGKTIAVDGKQYLVVSTGGQIAANTSASRHADFIVLQSPDGKITYARNRLDGGPTAIGVTETPPRDARTGVNFVWDPATKKLVQKTDAEMGGGA